jgi:sugar phosphate isomerase/epimerase
LTDTEKSKYPFLLGCTSYVYPADMASNAARLAPVFDDIELVFFQSSDACNFPDIQTIALLQSLWKKHGTTYTVHFPIDKKAGSSDAAERDGFFNQVKSLVELTRTLEPYGYILHLEGINRHCSAEQRKKWYENACKTCEKIVSIKGLDPSRICVENLDYPLSWHGKIAETFGFSFCIDLGHLFLYNEDVKKAVSGLSGKIRVIHLHGVHQGKDHVSLQKHDYGQLASVAKDMLVKFTGVVTLETFNETDTFESVETMKQLCRK